MTSVIARIEKKDLQGQVSPFFYVFSKTLNKNFIVYSIKVGY